jgi:hypothetical protein
MNRTLFLRVTLHFKAKVHANSMHSLAKRKPIYTACKFSYRNFFYRNGGVEVYPVFAYDRINKAQEKENSLYICVTNILIENVSELRCME